MKVNGNALIPPDPSARLIDYLRDDLGLTGTKEGCGMGECGSCTVLVDGRPVCSCLVLTGQVSSADVTTVEGIGATERGARVQDALVDAQAVQCGFCTAGVVLSAAALFASDSQPSDEDVNAALEGNLCRCTGYGAITRALKGIAS